MKMQREYFSAEKDGFFGAYFPNPNAIDRCMIALLGDDIDDHMAVSGVKWLQSRNCNVMTMAPGKKDYGHHSYPLERFEKAIGVIKQRGNRKIGIVGASTTGMMALVAASYYHDISLTIAMTPCDFIMEGFVRDGKDSMKERPADGKSTVTVGGKPLPYLPYAYRHPEYWQMIQRETKAGGDTNLPYGSETFDAVVITNALHIMPEPEKALSEARRVLKENGILIAPTFVHGDGIGFRMRTRMMELTGFRTYHKWDERDFEKFVSQCGFTATEERLMGSSIAPLCYLEARKDTNKQGEKL